jgi:hypothetical protein
MNTEILVAIVAGVFSVIAVLVSRSWENEKTRKEHLKGKKIPVYESLIEFVINGCCVESIKAETFIDFDKRIISWGSDEVFEEYLRFRKHYADINPKGILDSASGLLTAIRKDLDHKDTKYESMKALVNITLIEEIRNMPVIEGGNAQDVAQGV